MTYQWLLVAHIAVLGYWLGSELVINATYRYVCFSSAMPVAERLRLMSHVMKVDQHVRYALVLQAGLGVSLAALRGDLPGGSTLLASAGIITLLWLVFVEVVHRCQSRPSGATLARVDRVTRYLLLALLLALASGMVDRLSNGLAGESWALAPWLRWKLGLFAGVISCGLGIRLVLIRQFKLWRALEHGTDRPDHQPQIERIYRLATGILVLLWVFIGAMVVVSIFKPT